MSLKLTYHLDDHGWADMDLADRSQHVSMPISYLQDTLAELIRAANLLLKKSTEAKVFLMSEPGGHIIHLHSIDNAKLEVEVRRFNNRISWDLITEKEYEIVFKGEDSVANFSRQVYRNAQSLLDTYGETGYKEKCRRDFPSDEYNRLKTLLKG